MMKNSDSTSNSSSSQTTASRTSPQSSQAPAHHHQMKELARFGHSVTIINQKSVFLFGGAKGLSNDYEICNDSFLFQTHENMWIKMNPKGEVPSPRAAHSACNIGENKIAIFGGAGKDGLLVSDDLFVFDLLQGDSYGEWFKMVVNGPTPGKRYGHTMCYYKPYVIIIGGNTGNKINNEVWITSLENINSLVWTKLETLGSCPSPRMYHATDICNFGMASNMIIVFGGRGEKGEPLNDCWGLRKHRNGKWDWIKAPCSGDIEPRCRFQHTITFYYNFLIVVGGRNNHDQKMIPIEVYDTETSEWDCVAYFNKFRHCSWLLNDALFTQGGFDLANMTEPKGNIIKIDLQKLFMSSDRLKNKHEAMLKELAKIEKQKQLSNSKKSTPNISPINNANPNTIKASHKYAKQANNNGKSLPMSSLIQQQKPLIQKIGEMAISSNNKNDTLVIKQVRFDDNWKVKSAIEENKEKPLHDVFLDYLLRPSEWLNEGGDQFEEAKQKFHFSIEEISKLTKQCIDVVAAQPNVLKVAAPVKVFGDIHGQYIDLMNFFEKWGSPNEGVNGDILSNDYLFLGDYVDRGNLSLETICLLMALKVKYPDQVHLLRGNHEDILINSGFGFQDECERRLDDDAESEDSLFRLINNFFEYLPLAALIEDQILCLHGGIGANVKKISDIESIKRPLEVIHEAETREQKLAMDILWSDPTDTDEDLGIQPNEQRDSNGYGNIVKFGPDIVKKFLSANGLTTIIRAHECVPNGFERFAGGALITLFSATDYCGRHNNAGAMLIINQQRQMIPHLIYPPDGGNNNWIDDEDYLKKRPPTPPRVRYNKAAY